MIRVTIQRSGDAYGGYQVRGHADYAEEGSDIYCAAVSMLVINTANSIEEFCGDRVEAEEESGRLDVHFPEELSEGGRLLVNAMIKGLTDLQRGDGQPYLEVLIEEE